MVGHGERDHQPYVRHLLRSSPQGLVQHFQESEVDRELHQDLPDHTGLRSLTVC